jgi:hypothetical protein
VPVKSDGIPAHDDELGAGLVELDEEVAEIVGKVDHG